MPAYFYFFLLLLFLLIFAILRFLHWRKKSIPVDLFNKAHIIENNGHLEEAVSVYENALSEANKIKSDNQLKMKIIDKIKILHTIIEYNKGLRYVRQ